MLVAVGSVLKDRKGGNYRVEAIQPHYWDDGETGVQLVKTFWEREGLTFWVRLDELPMLYSIG